jgi:hypothetical protein
MIKSGTRFDFSHRSMKRNETTNAYIISIIVLDNSIDESINVVEVVINLKLSLNDLL